MTSPAQSPPPPARKPWPLSWVLIAILAYVAFQTAYFLFLSE